MLTDKFTHTHSANAGLGPRADYLATELDADGDLREPAWDLMDVSLRGVINTVTLALYHLRTQEPASGSVVVCGSTMGFQRCRAVDYGSFSPRLPPPARRSQQTHTQDPRWMPMIRNRHPKANNNNNKKTATAKHAVLGFARGLHPVLAASGLSHIRLNTVAPTWTDTAVLPRLQQTLAAVGVDVQPPAAVARAVALLFADQRRNGHAVHVQQGRYQEVDEAVLLPAADRIRGPDYPAEDEALRRAFEYMAAQAAAQA